MNRLNQAKKIIEIGDIIEVKIPKGTAITKGLSNPEITREDQVLSGTVVHTEGDLIRFDVKKGQEITTIEVRKDRVAITKSGTHEMKEQWKE
jgi:hypothetical protein